METRKLIEEFVSNLIDHIRAEVKAEMLEALLRGGGGRSIHTHVTSDASAGKIGKTGKKQRRKGPIQLCPVPGCKKAAAPVYGMLCADHKGTPKTLVKKYREARRAAKEGGKVIPIRSAKKGKAAKLAKAKKTAPAKKPAKAQAA
jgi:hypothetical protein